jgi:hypothetical protein
MAICSSITIIVAIYFIEFIEQRAKLLVVFGLILARIYH